MNRRSWLRRSGTGLAGLMSVANVKSGIAQPASADYPAIVPWPQSVHYGTRQVELAPGNQLIVSIQVDSVAGDEAMRAAQFIADDMARRTGQMPKVSSGKTRGGFPIRFASFAHSHSGNETEIEGGYRIAVSADGARIESRGAGFGYAASTFVQLLEGWKAPRLREVEIADWPEFPWRGIYVEVSSGACMTLQEWKDLVEWAAFLKLNTIVAGLYNCWQRPKDSILDSEYFLFPSRKYPQFKTPVRRYVREAGKWVERVGLPPMYRDDFLGEVVAFGKARGVSVVPYFSSLSHNTLIPRLMPEISMKDEQCRPIGYGFCPTCPKTYKVLFDLYDEIITRYARPYGITTFHAGMDEVGHACLCPDCRQAWKGETNFYVDHLIRIARRLKHQGMTRVLVWHDMLHRSGLINRQLKSRLAAKGLDDLITLCWWYYGAPQEGVLNPHSSFGRAFFRPEIGVDAWACPSAGWDTTRPLGASLRTSNLALDRLLRQGRSRGARGTLSYSNHDPMFAQGYVNFSQDSWNQTPPLAETQSRYARWLFGQEHAAGLEALGAYRRAYEAHQELVGAFYRRPAPPYLGRALASVSGAALRVSGFESGIRELDAAVKTLGEIRTQISDSQKVKIIALYRVEARQLAAFLRLAFGILECNAAYDSLRSRRDAPSIAEFAEKISALRGNLDEHARVMDELESLCYPPSLPRFMPYEIKAHGDVRTFIQIYSEMERRARKRETEFLPEISVVSGKLFAKRIGMVLPDETGAGNSSGG
ncbi:MAG TPA: glycoside hydrolase family 20 zincin-like fold domain-containing protein [Terriglobia bacterium]|nr:glycoside hydrolase family 20 zincin-like fold domain-containing protein [Terriglobia bacterium]